MGPQDLSSPGAFFVVQRREAPVSEIEIKHYDLDAYRMRSNQTPTLKHDDTKLSGLSAAVGRTT